MKSKNNITSLIIGFFLSLFSLVSYSNVSKNSLYLYNFEKADKYYFSCKSIHFDNTIVESNLLKSPNLKTNKEVFVDVTFTIENDSIKPDSHGNEAKASEVKKPFFGKIFTYGLPPAKGVGPCEVGVFKTSYFFGIKISGPNPVMKPSEKNEDILSQEVVGCGEEYVPEKEKDKALKKEKKEIAKIKDQKKRKQDDFLDEY